MGEAFLADHMPRGGHGLSGRLKPLSGSRRLEGSLSRTSRAAVMLRTYRQFAFTRSCAGTVTVRLPGVPPSSTFRRALLLAVLVSLSRFSGFASTWM